MLHTGGIISRKAAFRISRSSAPPSKTGFIRIDGKVRGNINGYIYADIHGLFRGELNAMVDIGGMKDVTDMLPLPGEESQIQEVIE